MRCNYLPWHRSYIGILLIFMFSCSSHIDSDSSTKKIEFFFLDHIHLNEQGVSIDSLFESVNLVPLDLSSFYKIEEIEKLNEDFFVITCEQRKAGKKRAMIYNRRGERILDIPYIPVLHGKLSASLVDDNIYIFKSKHKNFEVYNFAGEKIEQSSWKNAFPYIAHYDIHNARFSIVEFQFKNGKNRVEYKQLDNDQKTIKKIKLDENMDEINSDFIGWHNDLLYYYNLKQGELTLISPLGDHSVINVQEFGFTPASI